MAVSSIPISSLSNTISYYSKVESDAASRINRAFSYICRSKPFKRTHWRA
ncbi:predicted protein [Arabidopsis lyrata subsp. lyrata]|uniref:Predicted protein n=1 Tax=Arabidopsis lyrata subsp. lyrata TaxID=81972 RepID=D7M2P5_ARALL|nr:predicted protein [Arabidopsis lyrata subsp. lyrata]